MSVASCRLLEWPEHRDGRGALVALESPGQVPFPIVRTFAIYDVPRGQRRGGHAHRACHEVLVALQGTVVVRLDDGRETLEITLDAPTRGVHVVPGTWLELELGHGAVCLALCSHPFDEADYLRSRAAFLAERRTGS